MTTPSQPPRKPLDADGNPPIPGQMDVYDVIDHTSPSSANDLWPMATMAQKAQAAVHAKLEQKEKRKK
jgi:hypothetical protein